MLKFLLLLVVLFAVAFGFHTLGNQSGEVALTLGDTVYAVNLTTAVIAAIVVILLAMGLIWFARGIFRVPWLIARGWRRRNGERGREAVSQGLIAIAAGDVRAAERAMLEAARRTPGEPLTLLLQAQTAQLKGDRPAARELFKDMVENPATRIAGLRGLYIEAEREGEAEAARLIAERARLEAPSAPWAARALMRHQTAARDWDAALATLSGATDGRILDKRTARRQRAVILAAKALDREEGEPEIARVAAQEAHDLSADLVPAAVVAGRLLARQGDVRRATRILEASWKASPHPEIAEAYLHVRAGDSAGDRLKRAEALFHMRPFADEGRHAVARAAIDARDFSRAREILAPVLTERPTRKALMLMAELEEAESGDHGRARGWMARAVYATRDPAWTADGVVLEEWAPISPLTGRLDAVEWKLPVAEIEGPRIEIDSADLAALPRPELIEHAREEPTAEAVAPLHEDNPVAVATIAATLPAAPPRIVPMKKAEARAPKEEPAPKDEAPPFIEPPRPDDPGIGGDLESESDGRRTGVL